jgi:hypothetical protein
MFRYPRPVTLAPAHFLSAQQLTFTTFDPPGSTSTTPTGMNASGTIVGSYLDAHSVSHGFVRTPDGNMQTLDAPGWGTSSSAPVVGTYLTGISDSGEFIGKYVDANNATFGFQETSSTYSPSWFPGFSSISAHGIRHRLDVAVLWRND